jgi:hypothetical protein
MSVEAAEVLLAVITAIGLAVWISALQFLWTTTRMGKSAAAPTSDGAVLHDQLPANWFVGSLEIDGEPNALIDRVVSILVKTSSFSPGALGPLKIKERTNDRIVFEHPGFGIPQQGILFRQGRLMFAAAGTKRTHIDYALELTSGRWLLVLGWGFQMAGFLALAIGFWVVYNFCVLNLNPVIRIQTLQMLQTVHFLWPPFLFGGLYRQRRNLVLGSFETLLNNLPYME